MGLIIYKDLITDHEILSSVYEIKQVDNGLWEVDLAMVTVGGEDFVLAGANASAEGEDADEGGDNNAEQKLNLVRDFSLEKVEGLDKKSYLGDTKKYLKGLVTKLKENGKSDDEIKKFQTDAAAAIKKITGGWKDFDVYTNSEYDTAGMYILVNYREDGSTPFATFWGAGLSEMKV